jgi:transposase
LLIANAETKEIIAIAQAKGKTHDFKLFKNDFSGIDEDILVLADSGFQGILEFHQNSLIPIKKSKNKTLSTESKAYNHCLSKRRIVIENINRRIKRFDIFSDRYRNKRKRHGLRMTIVCALHNIDLLCA